ncbi:MAG: hypothetical protein D6717_08110 [Gammaproteobacteria bacterium]|nr:MAG: hypothetical protein D6717_08110 [Gammaproteobacteria bacterium]
MAQKAEKIGQRHAQLIGGMAEPGQFARKQRGKGRRPGGFRQVLEQGKVVDVESAVIDLDTACPERLQVAIQQPGRDRVDVLEPVGYQAQARGRPALQGGQCCPYRRRSSLVQRPCMLRQSLPQDSSSLMQGTPSGN